MTIPYTFAGATTAIPLAELDANFASPITLGNVAMTLSNTYTSIGNLTLTNVTVSSGNVAVTNLSYTGTLTGGTGVVNLGSGQFYIDSSGNVGIGTSSPSSYGKFAVVGSGSTSFIVDSGGSRITNLAVGTGGSYTQYYKDLTPTYVSSIGTYSPVTNAAVSGMVFADYQGSWVERMRIDSSGRLLVGQTATSAGADGIISSTSASGSNIPAATFKSFDGASQFTGVMYNAATSGNNSFLLFGTESSFTSRGSITYNRGAGLVVYNTTSDRRLKENIVDAPSALSKLNSVQIRSFDWKETGNHSDFGVIAQELELVAPECVTQGLDNEDGSMKSPWAVDTSALVPAMIKAIQELNAKVDAQANTIESMQSKLKDAGILGF